MLRVHSVCVLDIRLSAGPSMSEDEKCRDFRCPKGWRPLDGDFTCDGECEKRDCCEKKRRRKRRGGKRRRGGRKRDDCESQHWSRLVWLVVIMWCRSGPHAVEWRARRALERSCDPSK